MPRSIPPGKLSLRQRTEEGSGDSCKSHGLIIVETVAGVLDECDLKSRIQMPQLFGHCRRNHACVTQDEQAWNIERPY